jgi:hypothetical protein
MVRSRPTEGSHEAAMKRASFAADPLWCTRQTATRDQLEFACRALAADELHDHAIAAALELDVQSVRAAIAITYPHGDRDR